MNDMVLNETCGHGAGDGSGYGNGDGDGNGYGNGNGYYSDDKVEKKTGISKLWK